MMQPFGTLSALLTARSTLFICIYIFLTLNCPLNPSSFVKEKILNPQRICKVQMSDRFPSLIVIESQDCTSAPTIRILESHQMLTNNVHPKKKLFFREKPQRHFSISLQQNSYKPLLRLRVNITGHPRRLAHRCFCVAAILYFSLLYMTRFSHMLPQYVSRDISEILSPSFCPCSLWTHYPLFISLTIPNCFNFLDLINPKQGIIKLCLRILLILISQRIV